VLDRPARVLMITCAFPPTGGVGVLRALKFAKLLPRFGWQPWVWSATHVPGLPRDEQLLRELPPEVEHNAVPTLDPEAWLAARFAGCHAWRDPWARWATGLEWRLARWARWWLARGFPDDQVFWARRSFRQLLPRLRSRPVEAIFSTFSPASNHLLGLWLHEATGIPWIADFRDLWTDDGEVSPRWVGRRWAERRLERRCLHAAAAVTATDRSIALLAAKLPSAQAKFHLVPNGADLEEFHTLRQSDDEDPVAHPDGKFRLSFVGQFRETRVTPEYYEGIARFLQANPQHRATFEFRLVGPVSVKLRERADALRLHLTATGYVTHREALREMLLADVLLLSTPCRTNCQRVIPAKVYEYFAAQRPILAVGDRDCDVVRLVEQVGAGRGVPADPDAIAAVLQQYWSAWQGGALPPGCPADVLPQFSRQEATRRLANLLDAVTGRSRPSVPDTPNATPTEARYQRAPARAALEPQASARAVLQEPDWRTIVHGRSDDVGRFRAADLNRDRQGANDHERCDRASAPACVGSPTQPEARCSRPGGMAKRSAAMLSPTPLTVPFSSAPGTSAWTPDDSLSAGARSCALVTCDPATGHSPRLRAGLSPDRATWERLWQHRPTPDGDDANLDRERRGPRWASIVEHLTTTFGRLRGLRAIELGSGRGDLAALLAEQGADVTLLDLSPTVLEQARERFARLQLPANFVVGNLFTPPGELRSGFDVALSSGVIEHFRGADRTRALAAHHDVLRLGGLAIVSVPHAWCIPYRAWKLYLELRGWWPYGVEIPYSRGELQRRARRAGFARSRTQCVGFWQACGDQWCRGILKQRVDWSARKSRLDPLMGLSAVLFAWRAADGDASPAGGTPCVNGSLVP